MEAFSDIQQLWFSASTNVLPDSKVVMKTIRTHRRQAALRSLIAILFGIILLATMVWVLFAYKSAYITTRLGEVGLMLAIAIFLAVKLRIFRTALDNSYYNNRQYLSALKEEQISLLALQQRWQTTGFVLAAGGLVLYIYEEAEKTSLLHVAYPILILWFALNWFVVKPWAMKRRLKKDAATIQHIEQLIKQL